MDQLEFPENDPLSSLKRFTAARIALGRTGVSIPLKQSLEFKLAHAHARDAVYSVINTESLLNDLKVFGLPVLHLHSQAGSRHKYLRRPDFGRKLDSESAGLFNDHNSEADIVIIIADGLSADGINENTLPLLHALIPALFDAKLKIAPLCIVEQGRVAIGDEIAEGLNARLSILLIGERPGLSSANSIGVYLTYAPKPGLTDEARNCISNIRPQGLTIKPAAKKILYLINEAFKRKLSGVALKDNAGLLQ